MSRADHQHVMFTALLWLQRNFVEPEAWREDCSTRADFHFFHRRGGKILGGVQVMQYAIFDASGGA